MINHPLVRQKCAVFSREDAGDGTQLFSLRQANGKRLSEAPRGRGKTPGSPPERSEIFTDEDRGRNAEQTKSSASFFSGEDVGGTP